MWVFPLDLRHSPSSTEWKVWVCNHFSCMVVFQHGPLTVRKLHSIFGIFIHSRFNSAIELKFYIWCSHRAAPCTSTMSQLCTTCQNYSELTSCVGRSWPGVCIVYHDFFRAECFIHKLHLWTVHPVAWQLFFNMHVSCLSVIWLCPRFNEQKGAFSQLSECNESCRFL